MIRRWWNATQSAYHRLVVVDSRFTFALFAGFWSGVIAVLVDLDHITMLWGHPRGRVAHTPLLILACVMGLYYSARLGRLLIGLVLRKKKK